MKKYYPVDFDEKGNAVLGNAKSNPTSNGFIPTTWAPGGGSEDEGNGIKSITISPALDTTPALDSLFPIYWEDLTDEEKEEQVKTIQLTSNTTIVDGTTYTVTVTPTADWYATDDRYIGGKGEPVTFTVTASDGKPFIVSAVATSTTDPNVDGQINVMLLVKKS